MKDIYIEQMHLHMFKGHQDIQLSFDEINQIFGRNASGKSTIADAFCFAFTGLNFWGNKFINPINQGTIAWVESTVSADSKMMTFKRILEENAGKIKTILTEEVSVDKETFLSTVNPRYFVSLTPAAAKEVLLKVANLESDSLPTCYPETADIIDKAEEIIGNDPMPLIKKWEAAESCKKAINAEIKEINELKAQTEGKIMAYEQSVEFFKNNNIEMSEEMADSIDMFVLAGNQRLVQLANQKDSLTKKVKLIDQYRSLLTKLAVKSIEDELDDVTIKLEENGKDVFVVTYKDRDYKTLSNSEQLLAGLEIVNAISSVANISYPCFVDNAEALQVQDLSPYPAIPQFILLNVADVDLTLYENGVLTNPVTKETMVRSKDSLVPNVTIVGGWDR